jgi:hypothetical protein
MYRFARELGATIRPAPRGSKSPEGKAMWKAFDKSGFSKEIMTEYNRIIKPNAPGMIFYKKATDTSDSIGQRAKTLDGKTIVSSGDAAVEIKRIADKYGLDERDFNFLPLTKSTVERLLKQHEYQSNTTPQLKEGREGSLIHDVADSLPYAYLILGLDSSNNPYLQYKFGVAIAGARGKKSRDLDGIKPFHDKSEAAFFNDEEVIISFDPHIGEIIDQALKDIGMHGGKKIIGVKGSKEPTDTDTKSPVQGFRGFR